MSLPTDSDLASAFVVEVCVDSVESAIAAVRGGANRLELCGNLALGGGTTPSIGLYHEVRRAAPSTCIMVMIRPRTGDFVYTSAEFNVMIADIRAFKAAGADGVVFGALEVTGKIDIDATTRLVREATPMQICFHRAFDMTRDPMEAFDSVSRIPGVTRILTSGHGQKATTADSLKVLKDLLNRAAPIGSTRGPAILPGSGINPHTVQQLIDALLPCNLSGIHLSAGGWIASEMQFRREGMGMGVGGEGEWGIWRTCEDTVRAVRKIVEERVLQTGELRSITRP